MSDYLPRLQQYFAPIQPGAQITHFENITSGWENEVYAFTLRSGKKSRDLILRIYPGHNALAKAEREFNGMQYLYSAGFPVPEMIALEAQQFHQPGVIMERIAGQTLMQVIGGTSGSERAQHINRFCELFVRLHEVDWRPLADQPDQYADEHAANRLLIDRYRQNLTTTSMTCAQPVLDWVAAQTDALICPQPAIVHQDFHPDNVLWTGRELKVIDWTAIGVYDRRIDLAWTLLLAGVYEGEAVRKQLLHLYQAASNTKIEHVEIFEALACVRRFNDLWQTLKQGGAAWGLRPEAATAMRGQARQYQATYARLRAITGLRTPELEDLLATLSNT